jgi:hypothetical protein
MDGSWVTKLERDGWLAKLERDGWLSIGLDGQVGERWLAKLWEKW